MKTSAFKTLLNSQGFDKTTLESLWITSACLMCDGSGTHGPLGFSSKRLHDSRYIFIQPHEVPHTQWSWIAQAVYHIQGCFGPSEWWKWGIRCWFSTASHRRCPCRCFLQRHSEEMNPDCSSQIKQIKAQDQAHRSGQLWKTPGLWVDQKTTVDLSVIVCLLPEGRPEQAGGPRIWKTYISVTKRHWNLFGDQFTTRFAPRLTCTARDQ